MTPIEDFPKDAQFVLVAWVLPDEEATIRQRDR